MVELLTALGHMLELARHRAASSGVGGPALHQLVLILADGRFHEKDSLRRMVAVRETQKPPLLRVFLRDSVPFGSCVGASMRAS